MEFGLNACEGNASRSRYQQQQQYDRPDNEPVPLHFVHTHMQTLTKISVCSYDSAKQVSNKLVSKNSGQCTNQFTCFGPAFICPPDG